MNKWIAAAGGFVLCVSNVLAQQIPAPVLAANAWLLLDAKSGQTMAEHNSNVRVEPASLTKIMTAYLVFRAIKEHRLDVSQLVTVSTRAWRVAPESSKMFLKPGQQVSIGDLLYGLLVQSGNDAAVALAEATSGSVEAFVAQMNQTAKAIGLHATHFASPHGLPDPQTYSSARDLSILALRALLDYPALLERYDSPKEFTYNKIKQENRNRLLWLDPSVDGLKTGHTKAAGYCLIASAQRPGPTVKRRLVSVVLGTDSNKARTQESETLLNWGFQNFDTVRLYRKGQVVARPKVWKGLENEVPLGFSRDIYLTLPRMAKISGLPVITTDGPLIAPIPALSEVGTLKSTIGGRLVELPLVTLTGVQPAGLFGRTWDTVGLWVSQTFHG
ncbi:MAG: D-alanyl-D-alanine carboxypeptidase family protein [Burkholderiaceae bacterium]